MDLINWSLSAVDTIFSARKTRDNNRCPADTFPSGVAQDAWGRWQNICLHNLSIADPEDVIIVVLVIIGVIILLAATGFAHRANRAHLKDQDRGQNAVREAIAAIKAELIAELQCIATRVDGNAQALATVKQGLAQKEDLAMLKTDIARRLDLLSSSQASGALVPRQMRRHSTNRPYYESPED